MDQMEQTEVSLLVTNVYKARMYSTTRMVTMQRNMNIWGQKHE